MYRELTSRGVPFAPDLKSTLEATTSEMAELMKQMGDLPGAPQTTTEVVSVSTAIIPPSTFEIPAGYQIVRAAP
jgi:hypothetical protein